MGVTCSRAPLQVSQMRRGESSLYLGLFLFPALLPGPSFIHGILINILSPKLCLRVCFCELSLYQLLRMA